MNINDTPKLSNSGKEQKKEKIEMDNEIHPEQEQDFDDLLHSSLAMPTVGKEANEETDLDELVHNSYGNNSSGDEADFDDLIHQQKPFTGDDKDY